MYVTFVNYELLTTNIEIIKQDSHTICNIIPHLLMDYSFSIIAWYVLFLHHCCSSNLIKTILNWKNFGSLLLTSRWVFHKFLILNCFFRWIHWLDFYRENFKFFWIILLQLNNSLYLLIGINIVEIFFSSNKHLPSF